MNKILLISLLLAGCGSTTYQKFDGTKVETGKGGVITDTKGNLTIYSKGLPAGKTCTYMGTIEDQRVDEPDQNMFKLSSLEEVSAENGINTLVFDKVRARRAVYRNSENNRVYKKAEVYNAYNCNKN